MFTDDIQAISDPSALIYGSEPFHAHSAPALDAGLWPLVPVLLWGFVILRYLLRNYSLRVHLHALAGLFGGMPPFARIGAILFCAICISFGLPKQNPLGGLLDGLVGLPEPVSETVMGDSGGISSSAASASPLTEITTSRVKACSLLVAAETDITFTSEPSSNAIIHQPWLIRGAHEDAFNCAPEGWSFLSGTNTYTNVYVSSSGTLAFRRFQGSPGPAALGDTSAFYLAPLQAAFGIVPAANWDLLSASNSFFWHDVTEQGTARFTWRNALAGRSPDAPVSFQAELLPSGDFTFRYDLGSTPWPSNALAGTRLDGGGENALVDGCTDTNHLCASLYSLDGSNLVVTPLCARLNGSTRFALHWKAFLPSDLGDPDNDGIDTADELLVYHTGPRDDDSDDDGLPDGEEVSASLDPSRFSTATNGVSDLLTVITMAGLTNTSIRLGSGTLGTLVITSRLDTAVSGDAAILRITLPGRPSAYIPVLPGTDRVTSVSLPLDAAAVFSLVATRESGISGTPVLGIGADRPLILKDPGRLFGSAVRAMALTLPSVPPVPRAGGFRFPVYSIQPDRVCLHDPNLSFLTISSPDNALMMLTPSGARVYDMDVEWDPDWGELRVGANYRTMDVALSCIDPLVRVVGRHKARVHACRKSDPPGGSHDGDDEGDDGESGCSSSCPYCDHMPCSDCCDQCPDCEHHWDLGVPPPEDPGHPGERTPPVHVENRVFVLGAAAENHHYAVDPQPTSGFCPYCGHAKDSAGATDYATVTYCSGDLAAYPHVLRRSGEITVRGDSPSTNLWSSVLTIFHGEAYDQRRYTVLGTYPCESGKDGPAAETWNIPCGVTNAFDLHTDVLLQDGDVSVSLQGSGALFALNRQTWTLDLLCTTNGTYTADVSQWRDTYCDNYRQAQAFLLCESPGPGVVTHGYSHPQDEDVTCGGSLAFNAFKLELAADYADDGKIDDDDLGRSRAGEPLRLWINDDHDVGDTLEDGGSDVPGESSADCDDGRVNGRRDLLDLFPVLIDVTGLFNALGNDVILRLSQGNAALRGIITPLTADHAGDFLTADSGLYGADMNQYAYVASSYPVSPAGTTLPAAFVSRLRQHGKGVILVEGARESSAPLVLEASRGGTNFSFSLPLRIAPVEDFYRWLNLRSLTGGSMEWPTRWTAPALPDVLCNGRHAVFVHGYNVAENDARGGAAEMFKRLRRSGSRAMFTAVTWEGDAEPGWLPANAYYHADVVNAFSVADDFASLMDNIPGEVTVIAHSLGNMVVSSAVADHGFSPAHYFMVDAAVAREAYGDTVQHTNEMVPSDWHAYENVLWSSEWFSLFDPSSDARTNLTWRGRFGNIPQAHNYYSSGDQVLANNTTGATPLVPDENGAWAYQERIKGLWQPVLLQGVDSHGGWGFNAQYDQVAGTDPLTGNPVMQRMQPAQAGLLADNPDMLRTNAFFKPFNIAGLYTTNGPAVAAVPANRARLLAEALPALSRAAGSNPLAAFGDNRNTDLMSFKTDAEWPAERPQITVGQPKPWKHSDFKNVAYRYVYHFYDDVVTKGNLK